MGSAWWQCAACLRVQEEDICELQLNHCNLCDVPPDVFIYERTLEKLYLEANRIKDLPRPLFQCHELRVLSLSDNEITALPPAIASLINLENLDLSKNNIKELPDSIKECKNLKSIDISVNPFERFPDAITHIIGLEELYINDAFIEYLPANFGRLSALKTLELRENNMTSLPKSMSRLCKLQRLDIGCNEFKDLPEVVGELTDLTELWIDGNDIRRIPENIERLYQLNHFDCTLNVVRVVPAEIRGWRDISIINFSSNEIYELPDSVCYLRTIVTLKIDDNQLNSLPDDIGQMSNLEELIVTKNFLEYLPASLGLLRKLHCLNADDNYLRSIPPEIGSCTALSLLSLRSNNLTRIPPELGHLASLTVLNLVNNCITFLPVSMLNLTNLKALWLSDNQSQPLVPLQQEYNSEEDMMVLGCFMLPQKPRQEYEKKEHAMGPISDELSVSGRKICFASEIDAELPRQLHRAPTPYPKELRNLARHARNIHNQTIDSRVQAEPETMVKEAIVTKAAVSSVITTRSPTQPHVQPHYGPSSSDYSPSYNGVSESSAEHNSSINHEASLNAAGVVIATEKSSDVRQAKSIINPTSEYLVKTPSINDYVNSTWKSDEYSKTNTAKIVELVESSNNKSRNHEEDAAYKTREVPPVPPPYHIAAAFSKKAAFFQQLTQGSSELNVQSNYSNTNDQHSINADNQRGAFTHHDYHPPSVHSRNNSLSTNSTDDHRTMVRDAPDGISNNANGCDVENFEASSMKPSKIPTLRGKNFESLSSSNYDSLDNSTDVSNEDVDNSKVANFTCLPTSPVTGKKYRSPLCSQSRLRRPLNGNATNGDHANSPTNGSKDSANGQDDYRVMESFANLSEPETPDFELVSNTKNLEISKSRIPMLSDLERKDSDKKPKLKWMFGPHKNASVLPVQVRKNPGLGFSIAGGANGAQTGIIITKVNPDGPAQGTLRPGDKLLEVDGIDFTKSDHETAVAVLRSTGAVVSMMISRHQ